MQDGSGYERIAGLSYRRDEAFEHNPRAPLLDLEDLRPPARGG
jgi:hypothetical protein